MLRKISLRTKLTVITTVTMILISILLTIASVHNANYGFSSLATANDSIPNVTDDLDSVKYMNPIPDIYGKNDKMDKKVADNLSVNTAAHLFKVKAILYMIIIITLGSVFIYLILGKLLKPIKSLSKEVELINEHKLSQRVYGFDSGDEVSELAYSFNTMLDRLDKAFESQKRFSSDAAHELKTPLTVLKTNLDILEIDENPSKEDYDRTINVFKKQTERMINLVNNLFILSEQKGYEFNDKVEFDVIIEEIIKDLDNDIKDKNLTIFFNKSNVYTVGNSIMLKHAISNIVQNAIKYNNKQGSIFISVKENKKNCIIIVKDSGIGIPSDKVDHIFDAFYRVEKSRSRKIGGAGLGLAITKDIINSHGGEITYLPNKEGGSIFEITVPLSR